VSPPPDSTLEDSEQVIAELRRERDEALAHKAALAEVLQVINSSPGDLGPVFDAILEKAHNLCGVVTGSLALFDGEYVRAVAIRGAAESLAQRLRGGYQASDNPISRPLVDGGRFVHIDDLTAIDDPQVIASTEAIKTRTLLCVPLRNGDALLGMITAGRLEVQPFSDKEIALIESFAAQAVIAIENARLLTEMREALEQQTATTEVLQVINSSPGDLGPVFDVMLEKATRLCEARFGVLRSWDGEYFHVRAVHGEPRFSDWVRQRGPTRPEGDDPLARIIKGAGVVHFADPSDDPGYVTSPDFRNAVEVSGMRSGITVPLCKDDALLGAITIYRQEVRPFTDRQIALLQNFASQAVIAMENARLLTETREALEQQTATAEVLQVINASPGDLTPVFNAILEKAHSLCGVARGSLELYDGQNFRAVAMHGVADSFADQLRHGYPASDNPATRPLIEGQPFSLILDVTQHEFPFARDRGSARTLLCVALRRDDKLLGMIAFSPGEVRPFTDKQIALLQNFAAQAVIAMENARLLGELRQRTDQVAELNRGLETRVAEQVEELGRVGRLKRFLAPQLAELIVSQGDEKILESHRREIVVVFCDLRGYTAFTETAEPEEVLDFLREYHGALGPLVSQYEGTLDQFSGDGIMVFFNDPVPIPDPAARAVNMAVAMREAAGTLIADWRERGRDLGFGAGIAQGYATLGQIGFSERSGYTAIGTVCNVAARLCAEAKDGQILLSQRVNVALKGSVATEQVGALALNGLTQPVVAYNVPLVGSQAAFRVIEGGAPSA